MKNNFKNNAVPPTSINLFLYKLRGGPIYLSCFRKQQTSKPRLPSPLSSACRSGMATQLMLLPRLTYVHHVHVMWLTVSVESRARNAALKCVAVTRDMFLVYTATRLMQTPAAHQAFLTKFSQNPYQNGVRPYHFKKRQNPYRIPARGAMWSDWLR